MITAIKTFGSSNHPQQRLPFECRRTRSEKNVSLPYNLMKKETTTYLLPLKFWRQWWILVVFGWRSVKTMSVSLSAEQCNVRLVSISVCGEWLNRTAPTEPVHNWIWTPASTDRTAVRMRRELCSVFSQSVFFFFWGSQPISQSE